MCYGDIGGLNNMSLEKIYCYKNDLGYYKNIHIQKNPETNIIDFRIYSSETGDLTGSGTMTEDELDIFLNHYDDVKEFMVRQ